MSTPVRPTDLAIAFGAALLFDTCGECPQTTFASHRKGDAPVHKGAEGDLSMAKSWAPGNCTSWEDQIRARGQYQNEYNKTP